MKSQGILNKKVQKIQKKIFFKIFQIFKSQFGALKNPPATRQTPQKLGNFAIVHHKKKEKKCRHGFIFKISKTCFGGCHCSRLNVSSDGPVMATVRTAAVKLVYRYPMSKVA